MQFAIAIPLKRYHDTVCAACISKSNISKQFPRGALQHGCTTIRVYETSMGSRVSKCPPHLGLYTPGSFKIMDVRACANNKIPGARYCRSPVGIWYQIRQDFRVPRSRRPWRYAHEDFRNSEVSWRMVQGLDGQHGERLKCFLVSTRVLEALNGQHRECLRASKVSGPVE